MATLTLDQLSGGRMILGLGVSGPQVVEGWYGQPVSKPLARTREYVDIIRQVLRREAPVASAGSSRRWLRSERDRETDRAVDPKRAMRWAWESERFIFNSEFQQFVDELIGAGSDVN